MARRTKGQSFHDWLEEEQRDAILEQDRTLAAAKVRDITKYTDAEAVTAARYEIYLPLGDEPLIGQTYVP